MKYRFLLAALFFTLSCSTDAKNKSINVDFRKSNVVKYVESDTEKNQIISTLWKWIGSKPNSIETPLFRVQGRFSQKKNVEEILVFENRERINSGDMPIPASQFISTSGWFTGGLKNIRAIDDFGDTVINIGDVTGDGYDDLFSASGNLNNGKTWYTGKIVSVNLKKVDSNLIIASLEEKLNLGEVYADTCLNYREGSRNQFIFASVVKLMMKDLTIEKYKGSCTNQQVALENIKFSLASKKFIKIR
jgi:hypothetical protein